MYTPEINFLKQRQQQAAGGAVGTVISPTVARGIRSGANAVIIGAAFALVLVGAYGAVAFFVERRLANLKGELAQVETDLSRAEGEVAQLRQLENELNAINDRTSAFKSFFNQLRPWSSILEDFRQQVPANVWITEIRAENRTVTIEGQSPSFDSVNDYQLTLLQSPLVENALLERAVLENTSGDAEAELLPTVEYSLQVTLTDRSVEDLFLTLSENGSTGLIRKIEILRDLEEQT
ncbi:PilN domain-containing protein [Synechococcus sp. PCC 7336]|uniref:PilN domain-containing protein n=1 Tax=Synechococcus sp. PCC 7336 TaxID=195250 RepID=UPI00034C0EC9|nr:PilN domain-containing protein [Synechococcus sp. PCC 7336]